MSQHLERLAFRALAALLVATAASGAAAVTRCSISSKTEALMQIGTRQVPTPLVLKDCEGAVVVQGEAVACVTDSRGQLNCGTYRKGDMLDRRKLGPSGDDRGWLPVLQEIIGGSPSTRVAMSRGAESGLPEGQVALVDGSLDIDFDQDALKDAGAVEFRAASGSRDVVATVPAIGQRSLDASLFQPGASYVWSLRARSPLAPGEGRFTMATASERAAAQAEAARVRSRAGADEPARAVMLAAWLQRQHLAYDAARVLRQAGFATP